jgi:peptidoglycan hydrolase-like protein with peptidoglycan-binding domain
MRVVRRLLPVLVVAVMGVAVGLATRPATAGPGRYTRTAVTNFQRRWGLTPDGVVGHGTWWCLRAATCG